MNIFISSFVIDSTMSAYVVLADHSFITSIVVVVVVVVIVLSCRCMADSLIHSLVPDDCQFVVDAVSRWRQLLQPAAANWLTITGCTAHQYTASTAQRRSSSALPAAAVSADCSAARAVVTWSSPWLRSTCPAAHRCAGCSRVRVRAFPLTSDIK